MSNSAPLRKNIGAYQQPFSGVGIEYFSLGVKLDHTGLLIHEVGFLPKNKNWNFPSVFSPFWRLYYNFKQGHCVSFGESFFELDPQKIMLIPDHQMFHCLGLNPVPTFWISFSTDKSINPLQPVPIITKQTNTLLCLISDIVKMIMRNKYYEPRDIIYRHSLALLNVVISNPDIKWLEKRPLILEKLINYIQTNYNQNLSNSHLADLGCMSIEGLSKMFRKYSCISPAAYVTQVRIQHASHFLIHSSESIDWIAENTGFPNRNYFSRVFKKITNQSPARFRKLHTNL